jgi:3-hydroxybutyryl-CoA dehydrogenase
MAGFLVDSGYCSRDDFERARGRISIAADLTQATANADLVSESVFEDLGLKRELHRQLDEVCPPATLLTTNSSALMVSEIEDVVARGARFAALHSHLGALLFDIVGGPRTSPETIDVLRRYVLSLGGTPLVLKKEHPGYVFNAMNGPVLAMALRLALEDRATKEEVDRAWMSARQAPMGPFGMMDLFGLDLMLDSWRRPSASPSREALRARVLPFLTGYVEAGKLGLKTGQGFYDYPAPAFQAPTFLAAEPVSRVASDALLSTLVCGALSLVANEVAEPAQVDLAWTAATGQAIGPFGILDKLGSAAFLAMLEEQVSAGLLAPEAAGPARAYLDT